MKQIEEAIILEEEEDLLLLASLYPWSQGRWA